MNFLKRKSTNLRTATSHGADLQQYCQDVICSLINVEALSELIVHDEFSYADYQTGKGLVHDDLSEIETSNDPLNYVKDAVREDNLKNEHFEIVGVDILKINISQLIGQAQEQFNNQEKATNQIWMLSITIEDEDSSISRLEVRQETIGNAFRLHDVNQIGAIKLYQMETFDPRIDNFEDIFKPFENGKQKYTYNLTGSHYDYNSLIASSSTSIPSE